VRPERCLVFEDAPSGIRSGAAAGCHTLGVVTSHTREQLEAVKPTYLVDKLTE
jgi:glycerol 3-phosphatase-1